MTAEDSKHIKNFIRFVKRNEGIIKGPFYFMWNIFIALFGPKIIVAMAYYQGEDLVYIDVIIALIIWETLWILSLIYFYRLIKRSWKFYKKYDSYLK